MEQIKKKHGLFGEYLSQLRKSRRLTLRAFCVSAGADPGNVSRIERGIWPPPQDEEILTRYAHALDLAEGTDEWYQFFDYASVDRGMVPRDLMSDREVVELLPVFFRTLRGQKPTEDEMTALVEKLRRS